MEPTERLRYNALQVQRSMGAILRLRDKDYEVEAGMTVRDAMLRNGIQPESVIPTRDGELITDDEILREGERIRLVAVISGG
jgi:sulfur carrier protein